MYSLVYNHPYEEDVLIGISTDIVKLQEAKQYYLELCPYVYPQDIHIDNVNHDRNIGIYGYCVFSHKEMFGQVAHILKYVAADEHSAIEQAKHLHTQGIRNDMESEWLYEKVAVDSFRLQNGEGVYISEIDYSWNKITN